MINRPNPIVPIDDKVPGDKVVGTDDGGSVGVLDACVKAIIHAVVVQVRLPVPTARPPGRRDAAMIKFEHR